MEGRQRSSLGCCTSLPHEVEDGIAGETSKKVRTVRSGLVRVFGFPVLSLLLLPSGNTFSRHPQLGDQTPTEIGGIRTSHFLKSVANAPACSVTDHATANRNFHLFPQARQCKAYF